ncbi:hypothetical protein EJ997_10355 [Flaviflexus ciconiae]|uniref:Uncharacterized protein n=1 Tax=Flaviflexus ciconiae TaxID=2496867 RepID=A0A3S9PZ89_9ACTO|nr:hypothetical protein [Flaviflexus ciconiae]AZQ77685.1 hypothetical protein EJ997_10355 [Flaviflexus ciconiae]
MEPGTIVSVLVDITTVTGDERIGIHDTEFGSGAFNFEGDFRTMSGPLSAGRFTLKRRILTDGFRVRTGLSGRAVSVTMSGLSVTEGRMVLAGIVHGDQYDARWLGARHNSPSVGYPQPR